MIEIARVIAMVNNDLAHAPELAGLKNPVTVDHALHPCDDCGDDCWIGPGQLTILKANRTSSLALCYRCIITKPQYSQIRDQASQGEVQQANPDIESRPRRWQ